MRGGAAVDGDDQAVSRCGQPAQRRRVRSVAFADPIGDVDGHVGAEAAEKSDEKGAGGRAVNVVVAENGDRLIVNDGRRHPFGCRDHVAQQARVGQQPAQRGGAEVGGHGRIDAARRQNPSDHVRNLQRPSQCGGQAFVGRAEKPAFAAQRAVDAKDAGLRRADIESRGGERHQRTGPDEDFCMTLYIARNLGCVTTSFGDRRPRLRDGALRTARSGSSAALRRRSSGP